MKKRITAAVMAGILILQGTLPLSAQELPADAEILAWETEETDDAYVADEANPAEILDENEADEINPAEIPTENAADETNPADDLILSVEEIDTAEIPDTVRLGANAEENQILQESPTEDVPITINFSPQTIHAACTDTEDVRFKLTVEETGTYTFMTPEDSAYLCICDENGKYVAGGDYYDETLEDGTTRETIRVKTTLEAGKTYYFDAGYEWEKGENGYDVVIKGSRFYVKAPEMVVASAGDRVVLSVDAVSDSELSYQWTDDTFEPLPNGNEAQYVIESISKDFSCRCKVSDADGNEQEIRIKVYVAENLTLGTTPLGAVNTFRFVPDKTGAYFFYAEGVGAWATISENAADLATDWLEEGVIASLNAGTEYMLQIGTSSFAEGAELQVCYAGDGTVTEGENQVILASDQIAKYQFVPQQTAYYMAALEGISEDAELSYTDADGNRLSTGYGPEYGILMESGRTYYIVIDKWNGTEAGVLRVTGALWEAFERYKQANVKIGSPLLLSAELTLLGTPELKYHWYNPEGRFCAETTVPEWKYEGEPEEGIWTCIVSDGTTEREIEFRVNLDSGLMADAVNKTVTVPLGGEALLEVQAETLAGKDSLTYEWLDVYGNPIANEHGSSMKLTNVQKAASYKCVVSDGYNYKNVSIQVKIDSGFDLGMAHKDVGVKPGTETVTLIPDAVTASGTLTYYWTYRPEGAYADEALENNDSEQLTIAGTKFGTYTCKISDGYNSGTVVFKVFCDSGLQVEGGDEYNTCRIPYGEETAVLTITARSDYPITYTWYREDDMDEAADVYGNVEIKGETGPTLTVTAEHLNKRHFCLVSDGYNSERVYYDIVPYYISETSQKRTEVTMGGSTVLSVTPVPTAEGEAVYSWTCDGTVIEGADLTQLSVENVTDFHVYTCKMKVGDNWEYSSFTVYPPGLLAEDFDSARLIAVGEVKKAYIAENDGKMYFKFTPEETGEYTFSTGEMVMPVMKLYDSEHRELAEGTGNSMGIKLTYPMEAGKTYFAEAVSGLGSFDVMLKKTGLTVCKHEYGAYTVEKEPTCTVPGSKVRTCTKCGQSERVEIPAAHAWSAEWTVDRASTCTAQGEKSHHCAKCGEKKDITKLPLAAHSWNAASVDRAATCVAAGEKSQHCKNCTARTNITAIPAKGHTFAAWQTVSEATVFEAEKQQRVCSVCAHTEKRTVGTALEPTIKVTATSLKMQKGQKTTKFKVSGLAKGDSVASWKSGNTKLLKVTGKADGTCRLTAQKKTGTAKLTIRLASGLTKTVKVKIQKSKVASTSIKGISKKATLRKGKKLTLRPVLNPITSQDKIKYSTSNKKVATVSSKGVVKGIKAGTVRITVRAGKKKVTCTVKVTKR